MLHDYPHYTFSPEKPELLISFNTGMKLTLLKFIINDDLNFMTAPSLGFQVQIGDNKYPIRSFTSLISASQRDTHVVEFQMPFEIPERCVTSIKIVDQKGDYEYSISMVYDIQPL
jgi:hypothetical protein